MGAKYSPADAPIHLDVHAGDVDVEVRVRDEGPGIAPAEQKRIFTKFYRGARAKASGVKGTGLGLATVQLAQNRRDRRRQGRLAVVHVPNGAHVHVWLGSLEFAFCHFNFSVRVKSIASEVFKVSGGVLIRAPLATRDAPAEDRLELLTSRAR